MADLTALSSATSNMPMGLSEAGVDGRQPTVIRRTVSELQREFNPLISIDSSDEEQLPGEVQDEHLSVAQLGTSVHPQDNAIEELGDRNTTEVLNVFGPEVENTEVAVVAQAPSTSETIAAAEGSLGRVGSEADDNHVTMDVTNAEEMVPADDIDMPYRYASHFSIAFDEAVRASKDSSAQSDHVDSVVVQEATTELAAAQQADGTMTSAEAAGASQADAAITSACVTSEQRVDESFAVGQKVEMRDSARDWWRQGWWRQGYVTSVSPLKVRYQMEGPNAEGYAFDEVRATHEDTAISVPLTSTTTFGQEVSGLQDEAANLLSAHETVLPIGHDNKDDSMPRSGARSWFSCASCSRRSQHASKRKAEINVDEPAQKLRKC